MLIPISSARKDLGNQMRLIDADRLLTERMMSKYYHLPNGDIAIPIIDIKNAKTIDAVEVVRCKDCIHYKGMAECECVPESGGTMWFCAWGERTTDG